MAYRDVHDLTGFADVLGKWHAPDGFTFAVGIVVLPPGPQSSAVAVQLEYFGSGGAILFPAPVKARRAYRMLNSAAEMIVKERPERN